MWCYRRMLRSRISWIDGVTNLEPLERLTDRKLLWRIMTEDRTEWIGHTMRYEG